jgi:replicative DNA helicase
MMIKRNRQGDLDAELTLVRAAVDHAEAVVPILDIVRPDQFTDHVSGKIWQVVQRLISSGRPVDFDEVVKELKPDDVLGPDEREREETVADSVRETISWGDGTPNEARWCALRIVAEAQRQALLDVLETCTQVVVGHQSKEAKAQLMEALRLADAYHAAHIEAMIELERLQRRSTD